MTLGTIPDEPIEDAVLFGFDTKSNELTDFLTSTHTITPLVLAIHGEWGSGKSTLLLTTKKKLEEKIQSEKIPMKVVYFDAWQYEGSNPAAALVYHMSKPLESQSTDTAITIGKLAVDILSRKFLNTGMDELKSHFESSIESIDLLSTRMNEMLEKSIPKGKLVVLIDDLDRCTIENSLEILNSIKLFLSLKKCIFVVAVDMKKIELAWKTRYGSDEKLLAEGSSYLEKIFQIKTNVPAKTNDEMQKYLIELLPKNQDLARLITIVGPKNLRQVKRLLNLASFFATSGNNTVRKYELSVIWVMFEYLMKDNSKAITVYSETSRQTGHSFLRWIAEVIPTDSLDEYKDHLNQSVAFQKAGGVPSENDWKMLQFFKTVKWILNAYNESYDQLQNTMNEITDSAKEQD